MDDRRNGTVARTKMATTKKKYIGSLKDLILFEDDHIIVVNKPLDMASLDDKQARNLIGLARKYHEDIQLCHRLDKNTSGVLLMAKDSESYRSMALQFQKRQLEKRMISRYFIEINLNSVFPICVA